jgi:hypothetical protein
MNCCIAVREINQLRLAALPPEQKVNEYVSERRAETYGKRLVADLAGFVVFWPTIMDEPVLGPITIPRIFAPSVFCRGPLQSLTRSGRKRPSCRRGFEASSDPAVTFEFRESWPPVVRSGIEARRIPERL